MKISRFVSLTILLFFLFSVANAQPKPKFNYLAQKKMIPVDLGQVYLGMPFKQFAAKIPLNDAEADTRFDWLELTVPYKKGNITGLMVRIHGLSAEEKAAIVKPGKVKSRSDDGEEYERDVELLDAAKIPAKGVVYSMYITFKPTFDLKAYGIKTYGGGEVRKKDDPHHFYDTQWTKKTADGLTWLIRSFYEGEVRYLQLLGRIKDTEWDPEA